MLILHIEFRLIFCIGWLVLRDRFRANFPSYCGFWVFNHLFLSIKKTNPIKRVSREFLFKLFRPEFLQNYPIPLSRYSLMHTRISILNFIQ